MLCICSDRGQTQDGVMGKLLGSGHQPIVLQGRCAGRHPLHESRQVIAPIATRDWKARQFIGVAQLFELLLPSFFDGVPRNLFDKGGGGDDAIAVPEVVEDLARLAGRATDDNHVEIVEVVLVVKSEVVVADVASTENRHLGVGDHELVVHAAVEGFGARSRLGHPCRTLVCPRIEDPDFDLGVSAERRQARLALEKERVVDHDAHPNAAVGSLDHVLEQEESSEVVVPEIIEKVERSLRRIDQSQPPLEGLTVRVDGEVPGYVGAVSTGEVRNVPPEDGGGIGRQRDGFGRRRVVARQ